MKNGHTEEYWLGMQEGMKHQEPSPETLKRIESLEMKIDTLATKEDIHEMKEAFTDFVQAMKFVKFSGKLTYRILLVLATIVVSIVAIGGGAKTMFKWFIS